MPKNFRGENSKAKAAKDKKAEAQAEKDARARQAKEADEARRWEAGAKKAGKKEDQEAKRLDKLARKKEADALLESENRSNAKPAPQKPHSIKASARGAEKKAEERAAAREAPPAAAAPIEAFAATGIDDALTLLNAVETPDDPAPGRTTAAMARKAAAVDRHPERRMKAALAEYTERMLPVIKDEHPGLRLTQMKEIIFKRWQKAPENPFNQAHVAYNAKQADVHGVVTQETQRALDRLRIDDPAA
ncbi:hypothetical protein H4R18_003953 [Coemansia javaensis]|uniref:DUF1014-domain-containing protein n=1 Tax=Coemansia javaensis TaxID=2761396 RepID=A0A9W8LFK4_9FUNG|nr:hypothetical protein H4R18_003953 [Coemansia javaensis]